MQVKNRPRRPEAAGCMHGAENGLTMRVCAPCMHSNSTFRNFHACKKKTLHAGSVLGRTVLGEFHGVGFTCVHE
jgi:hypothetical protein